MDYGSKYADKQQRMIELRLQKVYREAQKDIEEKIQQFTEKHEKKAALLLQQVQEGKISEQQYKDWLAGQAFIGKRWEAKKKEIAESLFHANESAVQIVNGKQLEVFAENANYTAYQIETDSGKYDFGVNFDIYDTDTVARLIREKPELMPPRQINGKKDRAWNQGIISNAVTQAIIQGESIPKLAKRLAHDTASTNMKAMVRYARTAMTCAQNAGRMETLNRAQDMGIRVQKQWLSTLDGRTRDAHRMLDEQIRDIEKPFDSELGKIMFPGDPAAEPANVYNCRCTLVYVYPEYQNQGAQRRDNETGEVIEDMSYQEWLNNKPTGGISLIGSRYGQPVSGTKLKYRQGVANALNKATDDVRQVWGKYQSKLLAPEFDLQGDAAHFSRADKKVHFSSEAKAYEQSTYQEQYSCFFHEYGHNLDYWASSSGGFFSAEYNNGQFGKMIHREIEENLRDNYLYHNPGTNLWWEKDGFDFLLGQSKQAGGISTTDSIAYYFQNAKPNLRRDEYFAVRRKIYDANGDEKALRQLWSEITAQYPEVKKAFNGDRLHTVDSWKKNTYLSKNSAESLANDLVSRYNIYQISDVADMFDSYYSPMYGLNRELGVGHDPGYFGAHGRADYNSVAIEAFAEMFSAKTLNNQSLPTIQKLFPKSYALFEQMLGEIIK